jgi:simple sugar transport system permease protein
MSIASQGDTRRDSDAWSIAALLSRPELTAVVGTIVVFAFFAIFTGRAGFLTLPMTRNYLEVAAEIGIIAAPTTLLLCFC